MAAKHRMGKFPEQSLPATGTGARRTSSGLAGSGLAGACEIFSASLLCAAAFALITHVEPDKPAVMADQRPFPASQPVQQEGTVIAVTADSVTARSANGYTQTYRVTPNTAIITRNGSRNVSAPAHFAVNDRIAIVGTIRGGTALATAVAERAATRGDGRPMDFGDPGNS